MPCSVGSTSTTCGSYGRRRGRSAVTSKPTRGDLGHVDVNELANIGDGRALGHFRRLHGSLGGLTPTHALPVISSNSVRRLYS